MKYIASSGLIVYTNMAYQRSLSTGSFTRSRSRPVNSITPTAYTGDNLHEQSLGQLRTRAGDFMDVQFLEAWDVASFNGTTEKYARGAKTS